MLGTNVSGAPVKKLYGLDHLRMLAIILVFVFHYGRIFASPQEVTDIGKFGWTGVDLFFVLSGYLIASQLFSKIAKGQAISFREFFLKRFFRIFPAYWAILALYFLFPFLREKEGLAPLWKYVTFLQNINLDLRNQATFSHAWSLCIEEQFYLLLPLILWPLVYFRAMKKGLILLLVLFLAGFMARYYSWTHLVAPYRALEGGWSYWNRWIYYPTYCRLDGLLTGVFIAAVYQFRPLWKKRMDSYGNALIILSIGILAAAYLICVHEQSLPASVYGFPLVSIGYGVMVMGAVSPQSFLYRFKSAITSTIARLSYAIYLSHKIVLHLTQQEFSKLNIAKNSILMFLICILTAFLGAYLLNILIEKPFLKLRDIVLRKVALKRDTGIHAQLVESDNVGTIR